MQAALEDRDIRRILFVRTDRIGDVLMNLPALRLLRQTFPKSWITLMLDEPVADLLRGQSDIDEVWAVSAARIKNNFQYRTNLAKQIKKAKFDVGLASNPDKFLHAMLFFAGIPDRVGYGRKWPFFLNHKISNDGPIKHETEKNLDLVRLVSKKSWDGSLSLPMDDAAKRSISERLKTEFTSSDSIAVVHPGTSNPEKRWPEIKFAELSDLIQQKLGFRVVLIGGLEESGCSRNVVSKMKSRAVDWTGKLDLKQLSALFREPNVKALISVDSGPVHIAWISGKPVVALYAKNTTGSNPDRWGPKDGKSEVIFKNISEISVEEVYSLVKKVLDRN